MTKASEKRQKKLREKARELTSKEALDLMFGKRARQKLQKLANPEKQRNPSSN